MSPLADLVAHLLARLGQVREFLNAEAISLAADARFADALDSMGFVEFLALIADDCGVTVEEIERASDHRFGSVAELAAVLHDAGLRPSTPLSATLVPLDRPASRSLPRAWLAATSVHLPRCVQLASVLNAMMERPAGWLEKHAGIQARHVWDHEDPLDAAAHCAASCLDQAGFKPEAVGALLLTSEAPPLALGLAAAIHHRLGLASNVPGLDVGGACTGFLHALWTARCLLVDTPVVLIVVVEAPSRWLSVQPGVAGENAALFGDAAAACVLASQATPNALALRDVQLGTDGAASDLLRIQNPLGSGFTLQMNGIPLAQCAVRAMANAVRQTCLRNSLTVEQLAAIVAHGGNGRMSDLLARRLNLPRERIWSETALTGNLGSAPLPVAWASCAGSIRSSVVWTAVGAGLQWGAALWLGERPA
jgi:3-oxoacyl-[acyl-carrier-protein] synthase-3